MAKPIKSAKAGKPEKLGADKDGSTVVGSGEDDNVRGRQGDDVLVGAGGNDRMMGGQGNDRLYGGSGNDELRGDAGNDLLNGEKGDDTLFGGLGVDHLYGSDGGDQLSGGAGLDFLTGGADADQFILLASDADAPVNYAGYTVDNADVINDLSFVEGDTLSLQGFSNVLTAAGISGEIDTLLELAALAAAADSVEDFQSISIIMTLTDDAGGTHALRLMDYSVADFDFV